MNSFARLHIHRSILPSIQTHIHSQNDFSQVETFSHRRSSVDISIPLDVSEPSVVSLDYMRAHTPHTFSCKRAAARTIHVVPDVVLCVSTWEARCDRHDGVGCTQFKASAGHGPRDGTCDLKPSACSWPC